jgi:hypothetical protein
MFKFHCCKQAITQVCAVYSPRNRALPKLRDFDFPGVRQIYFGWRSALMGAREVRPHPNSLVLSIFHVTHLKRKICRQFFAKSMILKIMLLEIGGTPACAYGFQ